MAWWHKFYLWFSWLKGKDTATGCQVMGFWRQLKKWPVLLQKKVFHQGPRDPRDPRCHGKWSLYRWREPAPQLMGTNFWVGKWSSWSLPIPKNLCQPAKWKTPSGHTRQHCPTQRLAHTTHTKHNGIMWVSSIHPGDSHSSPSSYFFK